MPAVRIKDHWREQRLFDQRALVCAAAMGLATLALIVRLFVLQVSRHDYYADLSQGNRVRTEPIPPARGLILDRHGELIAGSQPAYQLELVPEEVPDIDATLDGLVKLNLIRAEDVDEIERTIDSSRNFDSVPIRLRMSDEDVARFAVHRFEFRGVDIKTRQTRWYPNGDMAVHALGYVGAISEQDLKHIDRNAYAGTSLIGKLGVESAYEKQLHGTNGSREVLVNAQGRSVERQGAFVPKLHTKAPTAGDDLLLSIDLNAQRVAEAALAGHRGAVVALDPNNGDVLALVSLPGFDPSLFARGITGAEYRALAEDIDRPLFNRALRGTYPSGSTIKPVLGLAALTDHTLAANTKVFCNAEFYLPGSRHVWRADKDEPRGWLDLPEAISRSSDVFFYRLASTLGIDRMAAFLEPFGYGQPTGIDIGGEKAGLLPTPEWKRKAFKRPEDKVWFPGETINMGIGQGYLLVTPLQLAHITGILAERGRDFRPRVVKGMRDAAGRVQWLAPVEGTPVKGVSAEDWAVVNEAMIGTTRCARYCGTAWVAFKGAAYQAAGKTGTAQVYTVAQNAKYNAKTVPERLRDHAWFIAYAPAEAPRIAIAVLVENAGFGSMNAAPVARKVLDAYLLGPDGKLKPPALEATTATPQKPQA
ncbi:MAG: penicillin-binding protein 2 [Gammaproteobacteria bacterium]|nr:penicillin-binding protein 2 [Gammaproteobacteria bacterium]MBV9723639.1 penicillin-binding protein 2 [Gammaproteobacteria bacterium]